MLITHTDLFQVWSMIYGKYINQQTVETAIHKHVDSSNSITMYIFLAKKREKPDRREDADIKNRPKKVLTITFPVVKNCKLKHVQNWLNLFAYQHQGNSY